MKKILLVVFLIYGVCYAATFTENGKNIDTVMIKTGVYYGKTKNIKKPNIPEKIYNQIYSCTVYYSEKNNKTCIVIFKIDSKNKEKFISEISKYGVVLNRNTLFSELSEFKNIKKWLDVAEKKTAVMEAIK